MLSNKLLKKRINTSGYYQFTTTAALWSHKWRPNLFFFIMDDFCVKYVSKRHTHNLCDILIKHYEITQYWTDSQYSGINLQWKYNKRTFHLSIKNYIKNILLKWRHSIPR